MDIDEKHEDILSTEWSYRFEKLQKSAMIMSYYKYGPIKKNHGENDNNLMDAVVNLEKRLDMYKKTGNTEFLVDVANFAMIEFMSPQHPNSHFKGTDSDAVELVGFGINQIRDEFY